MKLSNRDIIENASDAILAIDLRGIILHSNKGAEKLYGFDRRDLTGKHFSILLPTQRKGEFDSICTQILSGKNAGPFETERLTAHQNIIRVSTSFSPIEEKAGNISGISCIERKISELEVITNNAQELLETAPDAMVIMNSKGEIVFTNNQTKSFFGFEKEELLGREVEVLMSDRFASNHKKYIKSFFEQPNIRAMGHGLELFGKRKDGTEFPVEISLSPLRTKEGLFVSAAIRDVTERKQSDKKVKNLLQRIHLATSAINLGIWEIDFITGNVYWDENMFHLFDMPNGSSIDFDTWISLVHPEDRPRVLKVYYDNIQGKSSVIDFDLRIITPRGIEKYLLSKMLLLADDEGKIVKAIGANWDNTEQFKSKSALLESERKMGVVLRSTRERIYLLDKEGRIILMNEEARQVIQKLKFKKAGEIAGNRLVDIAPTELKEKVATAIQTALNGEEVEFEASTVIEGKEQWFINSYMPARNAENEIDGVALISLDISKRKHAELKQQALLQRLNLITNAVKLGTFERDFDTGEMVGDENLYQIHELDRSQLLTSEVFLNSLHPDDRERVINKMTEAVESKMPEISIEFRIITYVSRQEKYILNKTLFITDENGNIKKSIGSNWDITDLQKTREALLESDRKMKALLQSTREGIYLYDTNLNLILMNEQGEKFARMRSGIQAVLGQHVSEFTREDEVESVQKILQKVLEGNTYEVERNIPSEEGSLWLHLTYNPVKENDTIIGVCLVARDVTELVRSRENLVTARQRAEQSERLQEQFLANMSHEIRTPLNGIVGMSNLLLSTPLSDQQQEFLKTIIHSSDTLLFLINDILDLSKIKAGKFRIEKIPMDVYTIVEELTAPLKVRAREKGIRFSAMMDSSTPRNVLGDPHRLIQVLNNLLSNAIKFTDNGVVKLEVELAEKNNNTAVLNFVVTDSGIGIDEKQLSFIFESFAQEGSDTARKFGGTGLGLAITKRLVELQDGSISVTSEKGKGSRFLVSMPYELADKNDVVEKEEPVIRKVKSDRPDFTGKRVLVAEDNKVNQQVIRHLLKDYGMEVTIMPDGKQAIEQLEKDAAFDLIMLDLRMPVMDGFQALAWIRQKLNLTIPIVVLTASVLRDERDRCFELGANDYQAKPFSRPVLEQCLGRLLI